MPMERLSDLDELILRCRTTQAKLYISEAVACYRAGAFRACIVATWVAIVFDFIHKLRELEISGDNNAKQKLMEFEQIHQADDLKGSMLFEREMLSLAKNDFELISQQEFEDLSRLHADRHRCAHPSMNSSEDVYQPSGELARYHLRNAVTHLLQNPPLQGRAALARLCQEVESPYFPVDNEAALLYFSSGVLSHPRNVLVRNFVIVLIKQLLLGNLDSNGAKRYFAALTAVRKMHYSITELTFYEKINDIARSVPDDQLVKVFLFLQNSSDVWRFLKDDVKSKLIEYVKNAPIDNRPTIIPIALDIQELRIFAMEEVKKSSDKELLELIEKAKRPEYVDRALELYCTSSSWRTANNRTGLITSLASILTNEQIERVMRTRLTSQALENSYDYKYIIYALEDSGRLSREEIYELQTKVRKSEEAKQSEVYE